MIRKCEHCDENLPRNSRLSRKYCSDKCRKAANNAKNPSKRKEDNRKYYEKKKAEKASEEL